MAKKPITAEETLKRYEFIVNTSKDWNTLISRDYVYEAANKAFCLAHNKELDEIMEKQFSGTSNLKSSSVGGVKAAANILNFLDTSSESAIMDSIRETDGDLGDRIQDLMFVFDNLADVDNQGIQALLREVSSESLVLALKGADDLVKEKIFSNMSKRAAEMLRDDLESRGPVKLSDVEGAQKEILTVARRLADSGDIALGGKGAEQYI